MPKDTSKRKAAAPRAKPVAKKAAKKKAGKGKTTARKKAAKNSGRQSTTSAMPLYHQSYLLIRQRLLEGVYPLDQPMPPEEEIRQEFGVSRVTIRRALAELEAEGLIQRRRGSGTYPIEQLSGSESRANISGLYENIITLGLNAKAKLITFETISTPKSLARIDKRFTGSVLHIERVRQLNKDPFSFMTSYIPADLAQLFKKSDIGNQPLLMTLELAGIEPVTAEQSLSAIVADNKTAAALKVPVGSPLIQMKRLSRDADQRPIEYFESLYRPDRFEYRMTLSRVRGGEAPHWTPIT
jgi:GntR family transcriptional regulator